MGCHFFFQGIFLTQGSNLGLLHCRQILYWLGHQGSPMDSEGELKWNRIHSKDYMTPLITRICVKSLIHYEAKLSHPEKYWGYIISNIFFMTKVLLLLIFLTYTFILKNEGKTGQRSVDIHGTSSKLKKLLQSITWMIVLYIRHLSHLERWSSHSQVCFLLLFICLFVLTLLNRYAVEEQKVWLLSVVNQNFKMVSLNLDHKQNFCFHQTKTKLSFKSQHTSRTLRGLSRKYNVI